ncbi:hypothetical protein DYB26_007836 [Aphanomyces astaci]|uniref:Peptidase M20 dimerisation domain-containing protein n=2 Tax=Aphanomyces astaci TaxID=112090 RepID=A0A418CI15_APHAT|nr:hypothetical protein AaE_015459 [Aphanomyces astaci]RHY80255.1 hypothetical protein DYB26_007836 [Aphanomyces astaci]
MVMTPVDFDENAAIRRFQELLRIPTVSGHGPEGAYQDCAAWLIAYMQELGFLEDIHEFSPVEGKPIVVATWKGKDASLPSILLNSHYDVVPVMEQFWNYEPFGGELLENGMIVGRGAQDMKCVCVQYLEALRLLHSTGFVPARNIHLSYVPDEEIGGSDGMGKFLKSNQYQAMLPIALALDEGLANPTNKFTVFYGERTPWWLYVKAEGPTGHGSRFIKDTATIKLIDICNKALKFRDDQENLLGASCGCKHGEMKKNKLGDVTTVNLTVLRSGVTTDGGRTFALNVIPTDAMAGFDIRISPSQDLDAFKALQYTPPKLTLKLTKLGMDVELDVFPAATDSRFLRQLGVPALGFSPMNNTEVLLHEHNEMLHKDTFVRGIHLFKGIFEQLFDN